MANIFDDIVNKTKQNTFTGVPAKANTINAKSMASNSYSAAIANSGLTNSSKVSKTVTPSTTVSTKTTTNTSTSKNESIIDKINNWMTKYFTTQGVESLPDDSKWKQISQAADKASNGATISLNANNIGGVNAVDVYNGAKAATNFVADTMNKHEEAAIAKNEEAKKNGTQNILQKANDFLWTAVSGGEQLAGQDVKEAKQKKLDEEFNPYIDATSVLQKVKSDSTYASKLVNEDGTFVDYEAQIKSIKNEISKTADPYIRSSLQAQIDALEEYQKDQNILKYKSYYDQLVEDGATEDQLNQFKNYVISEDDTGMQKVWNTVHGSLQGWVGSFLNAADAIYAKTARILGYDYDAANPDSLGCVLIDSSEQLLANAEQGTEGVAKDLIAMYGGTAPFLYDMALAYATGGTSLSEMAADPKKAAQLADRALLLADVSVFGSKMKETMDQGYDFNHAFLNSTYHAVLNHASESIFGSTVENAAKLVGGQVTKKLTGKLGTKLASNLLYYGASTLAQSAGGEALEEGFEGLMSPIIDDLTLNTGLTLEQYLDKTFWQDLGYEMRIGALGGLVMGVAGETSNAIHTRMDFNKVQQFRNELQELYDTDSSFDAADKAYLLGKINEYNQMLAAYVNENPYTNAFVSKADQEVIKQTAAQSEEAMLQASQVDLTQKLTPIVELKQQMMSKENQLDQIAQEKLKSEGINISTTEYGELSSQAKIDTSLTAKYTQKMGKEVMFANITDANGDIIDGVYVNGITIINPNAKLGALSTLLHEYTHGAESSRYYGRLAKSVREFFGNGYDEAIQRIKTNYSTITTLDDAGAEKELVAITTQSLLDNYDYVQNLVRYNNDLAYKLFTDIKNLVTYTGKAENIEQNFRKAFNTIEAQNSNNDVDFSYVKNADIMADQKAWFENVGKKKSYNTFGDRFVTSEELDVAQKAMEIMARELQENADLLPKENTAILGTKEGKVLLKDASYGLSVENSTKCPRTLAYDELTNLVSEEVGRPLTAVESFLVSQKLYQIAVDPQCLYCYVALDRKSYNEFVGRYIEQRDAAIAAYEAAGKPTIRNFKNAETAAANNKLFNEFLDGRKATDNMWNRYKSWIDAYNNGTTFLTKQDVATDDRRLNIENNGGEQWDQLNDMLAYAQSASWAKKAYEYRAYFDEIRKLSQNQINNLNKHYGLRWYSFNDYTPAYILENMQQFTDASMKGLKGLAYTKDTDFARIFAPTGCNINISTFVRQNADGSFEIDPVQSADLQEAIELRNQYKNVGIVVTATSEAAVRWALQQEWSDVVIPFHIVRTGADIAEYYKWTVFNSEQNDTVIDKAKWNEYVKNINKPEGKVSKMIYPSEHQNDLNTYLNLCKERGLNPRFSTFLNEGDNYMKLVNETRQSDQQTGYLKPYFDMDAAQYSFDKFKEKGGFYGGWYKDGVNLQKEANDVANDILMIEQGQKKYEDIKYGEGYVSFKEYLEMKRNKNKIAKLHGKGDVKASVGLTVSDLTNYNTAVQDGDLDVAGKIVAKVAAEKGFNVEAWHGTKNFGFRVFKTSRSDNNTNVGSHFGTQAAAEGFANGEFGGSAKSDSNAGVYHVYLKANNPWEAYDMFAQGNSEILYAVLTLQKEIGTKESRALMMNYLNSNEFKNSFPYNAEELIDDPDVALDNDFKDRDRGDQFNPIDDLLVTFEEMLKIGGYDSISYMNDLEDDGNIDYVILNPEQIKSADPVTYDEDGNVIPLEERFDINKSDIYYSKGISLDDITNYNAAAEVNDTEAAQAIVDRVAAENGYIDKLYRVDNYEGNRNQYQNQDGVFYTDDLNYYEGSLTGYKAEDAKPFYLSKDAKVFNPVDQLGLEVETWANIQGPIEVFEKYGLYDESDWDEEEANGYAMTSTDALAQLGNRLGYDVTIIYDVRNDGGWGDPYTEYAVHNSNVIKSADPFTYDDQGNLIPLDQRFNNDNADIRYSKGVTMDSLGKELTENQKFYFKNSKAVDENGNLKVMYHGTDDAGFTIFDPSKSDDKISLFFTDNPIVADTYVSQTEDIEGDYLTFKSIEDFNNNNTETTERIGIITDEVKKMFIEHEKERINGIIKEARVKERKDYYRQYKKEQIDKIKAYKNGQYYIYLKQAPEMTSLYHATKPLFDTEEEVLRHFGTDDYLSPERKAKRYEVYLNIENPIVIDANYRGWNRLPVYSETTSPYVRKYNNFNTANDVNRFFADLGINDTFEAKANHVYDMYFNGENVGSNNDNASWESIALYKNGNKIDTMDQNYGYGHDIANRINVLRNNLYENKGIDSETYHKMQVEVEAYDLDADGDDVARTRDWARYAKENGYDGLIIKNVYDNGGAKKTGKHQPVPSTVMVAFNPEQIKSVNNENPTADHDINLSFNNNELANKIKEFNDKGSFDWGNALDIVSNAFKQEKPIVMQGDNPNFFIGLIPKNLYNGMDEGFNGEKIDSKYRAGIFDKSDGSYEETDAVIHDLNSADETLEAGLMLGREYSRMLGDEYYNENNLKIVDPETSDVMYSKGMTMEEIKKDNEYVEKAQSVVDKINDLNGEGGIVTIDDINDILSQTNWGRKAWKKQNAIDQRKFDAIERTKKVMIEEAPNWIKGYDTLREEYPMFTDDTFNNAMYETLIYGELSDTTKEAMKNTLYANLDLAYNYRNPNTNVHKLMGIDKGVMQEIENFVTESLNTFENETKYQAGDYDKESLKKSIKSNKGFESKNIEGKYQEAKAGSALDRLSAAIKKDLQAYWQPVVDMLYKSDLASREVKSKRSDRKVSNWKTIDQNIFEIANGNKELYNILKKQIRYEMLDTAAAAKSEVLNAAQKDVIDKVKELGIVEGTKEDIALQYYMEGHTEKKRTDLKIDGDTTKETLEEYRANPYEKYTLADLKKEFNQDAANGKKVWENIVEAAKIMRNGYDQTYSDIVASQTAANGDIEGKAEAEIAEKLAELNKAKLAMDNVLAEIKKNGSKESTQAAFEINKRKFNKVLNEYNTLVDRNSKNDLTRRNLTPYRENYVHHIVKNNLKEDFLSIINAESNIPTELAGTSDFTKPNTAWSSFSMAQEGGRYTPTALGSYTAYMDEAANVLAYNPVILSVRQLNKDIKATAKGNELSRLSEYLNDYANMLAGKRDSMDRGVQKLVGPQGMMLIRKLNSYAKAAALTGNIKSGLTQFANIPNGMAILESRGGKKYASDMGKGIVDWIKTWNNKGKTAIDQSSFMNNRYFGFDTGKTGFGQTVKNATDWILTVGDKIGAETIWWSAYEQGVRLKNETGIDPILYADDITRSAIAGRTKEDMALAMQSQTINLLLPFQVENNNLYQTLKQQGASKHIGAIATYNVAAFIFNMIIKAIIGNDDEVLPEVLTPIYKETKKTIKGDQTIDEAAENVMFGEIAEFVSLLPYGSTAIQLMLGNDSETVFGDYDPNRYGATNIGLSGLGNLIKDMKNHSNDPNQQIIDIFDNIFEGYVKGGKQIMRTVEGLQSMGGLPDYKGGEVQMSPVNYTTNGENIAFVNDQENIPDWIRAALFGKWNTSEAQNYIDSGFKSMSKSARNVFDTLEESSAEGSTYDNYKAAKEYQASKSKDKDASTDNNKEVSKASTEETEEKTLREQLIEQGKYGSYKDTVRDAYDEYLKSWYKEDHEKDDEPKTFTQFANSYGLSSDDLKQDTYGSFYDQYKVSTDAQKAFSEALDIKNSTNALGKTITNSAATQRRVIYEELGIYDQILEFIEDNGLEYSDFGLSKTVVEYDQEKINKMLAKIAGETYESGSGSGSSGSGSSSKSSTAAAKKKKKAMQAYMSAITSANKNIFSNLGKMTSVSDAKANVKKIMQDAYKG